MIILGFFEQKARKEHFCDFVKCHDKIEKGSIYLKYDSGRYGGIYYKLHPACYKKQLEKELKENGLAKI